MFNEFDFHCMRRAIHLAAEGQGAVEPNPMVGCVIVQDDQIIGEGYHGAYGGPHAEVVALDAARHSQRDTVGATMYVTLEPCCHHGKTPPCTRAILEAGVRRVVVAQADPFPEVSGIGIQTLREEGAEVQLGLMEQEAQELNAPYLTLIQRKRPWVIAKWAMTADGKTATATGSSQWISNERSRRTVHQLRARMDAIMIGAGTARNDDPALTVRLDNPTDATVRTPMRIVWDSHAALDPSSQLVQTAEAAPVMIIARADAPKQNVKRLQRERCEVFIPQGTTPGERVAAVFHELGRRRMTNVLVEGGGILMGTLFDARMIDEAHVFIAPKLAGGKGAVTPIAGQGIDEMANALTFTRPHVEMLDGDIYLWGRVER